MDNQEYINKIKKENESLKTQINDLVASKETINKFYRDLYFYKNIAIAFLSLLSFLELMLLSFWVFT